MRKRSLTTLLILSALFVVLSVNAFAATPSYCDPVFQVRYQSWCPFDVADGYYLTQSLDVFWNGFGGVSETDDYTYEFDQNGKLVSQSCSPSYSYDSTSTATRTFTFSYDEKGNMIGMTDGTGYATFDDQHRLIAWKDTSDGSECLYSYNDDGVLAEKETSSHSYYCVEKYNYNEDGSLLSVFAEGYYYTDANFERETLFYYNDAGVLEESVCTEIEKNCEVTTTTCYEFDANGNNIGQETSSDGVWSRAVFSYEKIASAVVPSFIDVPANAYYADAVAWATKTGVTAGVGDNKFAPDASCTRAQLVTFLWRAAGRPEPETTVSPFTDVQDPNSYYYNAVLWAVENGITAGVGNNQFGPDLSCTRGQIVTFIYNASGDKETYSDNPFRDVKSTDFYYNAVLWAVANGVTAGTSNTTFSPNETCTRAQGVTFLYRGIGLY